MKILFVQPNATSGRIGFHLAALSEPLALQLLAGMVPDHEPLILDLRLEDDLMGTLERFAPDVVAVTTLTTEVYAAQAVLRTVKEYSREIFTLAGGQHATLVPADFCLPFVDGVGLGEGELVFPDLIEQLANGRDLKKVPNLIWQNAEGEFVGNGRSQPKIDLDQVPLPRRDLVQKYRENYFFLFHKPDAAMATGRGCPFRCSFCSVWKLYEGRTCQMTPERVVREIRNIETQHITFVDDNFMMSARREDAIADLIRAEGIEHSYSMECRTDSIVRHPELIEKWAKLGLYAVLLGLEGTSDKTLQMVGKKNSVRNNDKAIKILHDNGVVIWGAFLIDPDWAAEDFENLSEYVHRKNITHTQFTIITPLPGTPLYEEKFDQLLTRDYTCFDTLHSVLPTRLPREEFYQRFADLYGRPNLARVYDMIRAGTVTIDDVKRGNEIYRAMSSWEFYTENDPVLRQSQAQQSAAYEVRVRSPNP